MKITELQDILKRRGINGDPHTYVAVLHREAELLRELYPSAVAEIERELACRLHCPSCDGHLCQREKPNAL